MCQPDKTLSPLAPEVSRLYPTSFFLKFFIKFVNVRERDRVKLGAEEPKILIISNFRVGGTHPYVIFELDSKVSVRDTESLCVQVSGYFTDEQSSRS